MAGSVSSQHLVSLGQYVISPGNTHYYCTELAVSSLVVVQSQSI